MTADHLAAEGYNRVPVTLQILADLDTPLSAYLKLARQPWSYLLESAQGGETWGRYSIIGLPCRTVLKAFGHRIEVTTDGRLVEEAEVEDPLAFVEAFQARYRVAPAPGLPRFYGGLVGYFGYDCVRYVEKKLKDGAPPDPIGTPDILLMVSEDIVIFDNLQASMQLISLVDPNEVGARQRALARLQPWPGTWAGRCRRLPTTVPLSQWLRATSFPNSAKRPSRRRWSGFANTPAPGMSCRWCCAAHVHPLRRGPDQPLPRFAPPQSVTLHVLHGP